MTKSKHQLRRDQYDGKFDPKPLKGGRCASCGGALPPTSVTHGDPFCSTGCARIWFDVHGVDATVQEGEE
jgi:hypothetical protein